MNKLVSKKAALALGLGVLAGCQGARADDTSDEIRALKAQLKRLETKVEQQAQKQKQTQVEIHEVRTHPAAVANGATPAVSIAPLGGPAPGAIVATESAIRGLPVAGAPSLYINGVSITPGGFIALEGVFRDRFIGADIGTPFQNIPFGNVRSGNANEFRMSARQSRVNVLVEGSVNPTTHLAAFVEMDFLGAAQTANSNESNSFNPRIRHLYATVDQDDFGAHLLAGQSWSLVTMNAKGIIPRQENLPLQIDAQYVPGFVWARNPQIRIVKDFDKTFWAALSVENPQTTFGGFTTVGATAATLPSTLVYNVAPPGGSLFNSLNAVSLNHMPDIIGKAAWDTAVDGHNIHLEGFGLFRDFYSQVNNSNQDTPGWGTGGSALVSLLPKQLEAQFSGMTGRGIGRYGSAQLPDVTFNWNGTIDPIPETMLLAGLVWHPTSDLDLYAYGGEEFQTATFSTTQTGAAVNAFGLGNPLFSNAGCSVPGSTVCNGNIHLIRQLTGGFWQKIYQGAFGQLRAGLQYSFTQKYSFQGIGGGAKAQENMGLFSIRYYPF
ncbi:conserved hypothetical protein [Methylocella silvestris BL2]|uniref:Porin n=1 Tax=Methylocella silvestris (strain DSM 15510 / CIP 108128 / LMG 27833 / NCIMB 13906 / BL2) TaxID=395965 RepID=B8ES98_METSB|nr:hypothetical protein [Methylocella silvestris]ACK52313.1 conserved hypothetical protein [Methylocella silvestris BL2]